MNAFSQGADAGLTPRLPRKNLLLAATIEAGALRANVRLRNISGSGAMLEGPALPDPGIKLILRRADIQMGAIVVWRLQGRCGIRFDEAGVTVEEWVSGVRAPTFNGQQGQARVDAIQSAVRSGAALPAEPPAPSGRGMSAADLDKRIGEEIVHVRRLLEDLGEEVAQDPIMLQRHARALQNLDRACQILEHLGTILNAPDRVSATEAVSMQELRTRLLRKPIFG